jgi:hypothetical protein
VEASIFRGREVVAWWQSKTTGLTVRKKVFIRQFTEANNGILADSDPELDTTNTEIDSEIKKVAEVWKFHRMVKVNDILETVQGSENLCATPKESRA